MRVKEKRQKKRERERVEGKPRKTGKARKKEKERNGKSCKGRILNDEEEEEGKEGFR